MAGVAGAELWVRSLDRRKAPMTAAGSDPVRRCADPRIGYENDPGAVQVHRYFKPDGTVAREIRIAINGQGFRGPEVEPEKPAGTLRIVAIGDSQTYGSGVQEEEAWPAVLERALAGKAGGARVQVMNCGVGGYDTEQEAAALEGWLDYGPDLVLLGFFVNDAAMSQPAPEGGTPETNRAGGTADEVDEAKQAEPGGAGRPKVLLRFFLPGRPGVIRWLRQRSHLVDYLSDGIYHKLLRAEWRWGAENLFRDDAEGWIRAQAALVRARDVAEKRGARFGVVLLPFLVRAGGGLISTDPYRKVAAFCREKGISCLDLEKSFEGLDPDRLRVHPRDWHTGPEAQSVQGEAVARWIAEQELLPLPRGH